MCSTEIGATILSLIGAAFYTLSGFAAKRLSGNVSPLMIALIRTSSVALFSLFTVIACRKKFCILCYYELKIIFVSSAGYLIYSISLYYAFQMLPLGDVVTLTSTTPLFIIIFSSVINCKPCSIVNIFVIFLTTCGVVLCAQPSFIFESITPVHRYSCYGYVCAVIAAISSSVSYLSVENVKHTSCAMLNLIVCIFCIPIILAIKLYTDGLLQCLPESEDQLWLFAIGCFSIGAVYSFMVAVTYGNAFTASIGLTVDIAFSFILDIMYFKLFPNVFNVIGATLIVFAIFLKTTITVCSKQSDYVEA
ncbi:Uncharacterised protein r2_g2059 [Pycnogonum litorale]